MNFCASMPLMPLGQIMQTAIWKHYRISYMASQKYVHAVLALAAASACKCTCMKTCAPAL